MPESYPCLSTTKELERVGWETKVGTNYSGTEKDEWLPKYEVSKAQ